MGVGSGSVYLWIGSAGASTGLASNWRLVSGSGNSAGRPHGPGDGAIVSSGGMVALSGGELIDNTLYVRGGTIGFVNSDLLGPVAMLQLSGTPKAGDVIHLTISTPASSTPVTASYTVTANDVSSGDALGSIAQNIADALNGAATARLEIYKIPNPEGSGNLAFGSFAGEAVSVSATVTTTGSLAVGSAVHYPEAVVTDQGASAGASGTFAVSGSVHNGGAIIADVSSGHFLIDIAPANSTYYYSAGSGTSAVAGVLDNLDQILVTSGDHMVISAVGSSAFLENYGTIDVANGGMVIEAPMLPATGVLEIGGSGKLTLADNPGGEQSVLFDTATSGGVLVIDGWHELRSARAEFCRWRCDRPALADFEQRAFGQFCQWDPQRHQRRHGGGAAQSSHRRLWQRGEL